MIGIYAALTVVSSCAGITDGGCGAGAMQAAVIMVKRIIIPIMMVELQVFFTGFTLQHTALFGFQLNLSEYSRPLNRGIRIPVQQDLLTTDFLLC
jgi:hypothetical protein